MSIFPIYERMVRGSNLDPNDYDYFNRGSLRAQSAIPESLYLRHHDSKCRPGISRGLSSIRDMPVKPSRHLTSADLAVDLYPKAALGHDFKTNEGYCFDQYVNTIGYPGSGVYISNVGRQYPVYATRRPPTGGWSYYPYPPSFEYPKSSHRSRTARAWDWSYPYRYSSYYRPAYIHSPVIRRFMANIPFIC